ncbi:hypothetical protein [Sporomusa aerivorans]
MGVATFPQDTNSIDKLLELADGALYASKKNKNKVTAYTKQ